MSETDSWTTLADYYPADQSGSNITYFVDTNLVDFGSGGYDGGGTNVGSIEPPMMAMGAASPAANDLMVLDGSGGMAPLFLYPPGFDLSGLTILDPSTGQTTTGSGLVMANNSGASPNGADGANGTNSPPVSGTGFYRVVRDGAHMFGVTNGAVWSGKINVPLEVSNPSGPYGTVVSVAIDAIDENGTQHQ